MRIRIRMNSSSKLHLCNVPFQFILQVKRNNIQENDMLWHANYFYFFSISITISMFIHLLIYSFTNILEGVHSALLLACYQWDFDKLEEMMNEQ